VLDTQLDRQRNADGLSHLADQIECALVQARTRQARIGWYDIHIQLQRIGTCFFDQACVLEPAT